MEEKTWKVYQIPYYVDPDDPEMTMMKYVNDLPFIMLVMVEDFAPNHFNAAIKATDAQHAELAAHDDVEVIAS